MKKYEQAWLERLDDVIHDNIENPDFQLLDITNELEISRTQLYRNMLKLKGMSPNEYIRKIRLEKAKQILEVGEYPTVKQTAKVVGYRRPEYFTKLFYRMFKVLPSSYLRD